ncbi:MAG: alanine dehydrogenase [Chitinophagaceae bacterium]
MSAKNKPQINVSYSYNPLEETLEVIPSHKNLYIGIPNESEYSENRVPLIPSAVHVLVNNGHRIAIESNAGLASAYTDNEYSEAGAQIVHDKKQVFEADLILKTATLVEAELPFLKSNQIIFSPVHSSTINKKIIETCLEKKIIGISIGNIKDDANNYPIVRAMSQIAGVQAIHIASYYLSNNHKGRGILMGGIAGVPPATVVIIGAGMVGEFAARTAIGCGADVKVFDNSIYRLMRLQRTVGQTVYTSVIDPKILTKVLKYADVVIGAVKMQKGVVPLIVTENMVEKMKLGSVIIDINIDHGGCIETSKVTSHENPVFTKHGVIHYCVPNIASGVARTSSKAISNNLMPLLLSLNDMVGGATSNLYQKPGLLSATYMYKGKLTSKVLSKKFNLKFTDLNLILNMGIK